MHARWAACMDSRLRSDCGVCTAASERNEALRKIWREVGVTDELASWGDIWPPDGLPQPVSQPAVSPNNPNGEIQK